ncbi:hypothetical protein B296_00032335 [Ensete ventricosum]|uniref:Uncharacterized protein n=1 Tax=Ensete ventricosum TaxID=4639 RepID=A0A426Y908_ENSVE|nr:hypothetical protein B296_00032335 [Ensete ventricosum]
MSTVRFGHAPRDGKGKAGRTYNLPSPRALPLDVGRWVVVVDDKDIAVIAMRRGTPNGRRVLPHHPRVVAANLAVDA